jgi:hypothetical protein
MKGISVDRIREGVLRFRKEVFPGKREIYESLAEKQKPFALFLTCGDSRIEPATLTPQGGPRDHATVADRGWTLAISSAAADVPPTSPPARECSFLE